MVHRPPVRPVENEGVPCSTIRSGRTTFSRNFELVGGLMFVALDDRRSGASAPPQTDSVNTLRGG